MRSLTGQALDFAAELTGLLRGVIRPDVYVTAVIVDDDLVTVAPGLDRPSPYDYEMVPLRTKASGPDGPVALWLHFIYELGLDPELRAAVRRSPSVAADQLRSMGYADWGPGG